MGDPGRSEWDPRSPLRAKCREIIKQKKSDRVNGKGSAASSSAVPRRRRCSGGACSRSCSPPKASEVEQAGSPQAPIFGRRETSDAPLGATCVLDRGKSILIAVEDHVGGGGGEECSYQAPEADILESPQNSRAFSQGHGHDKKKKKKTNDAADTVATSSSTVPGNLFPTAGPGTAPAERTIRGIPSRIRLNHGKYEVEMRVAGEKQKLLGFDRIYMGSYNTPEQAFAARIVGDFYCGKWPPDYEIPDLRILSFLLPLEKLDKKKQIKDIARWAASLGRCTSGGTFPLWTHPGRGLINAAAAAPVQQQVEIEGGFSHFEPDQAQRAAAAAGVNNPRSNFYQIGSHRLDPDTTQQDAFPNTQELQHLSQQRSSHGTAAAGDSQYSHDLWPQLTAVELLPVDQHSGDSWDIKTPLKEGQVPCTDFLDQFPDLIKLCEEINSGNLQSDMEFSTYNIQESEVDYTLFKNHMLEADQARDGSSHGLLLKIDWGHEHVQENQGDEMLKQMFFDRYWNEIEAGQFLGAIL